MKLALICLAALCCFPTILTWATGYYRNKQFGKVDQNYPRNQSQALEGVGARLVAAQANTWEAIAVYTAALVAVSIANVPGADIKTACLCFISARVLFIIMYIADQHILRSLSYMVGFVACLYMIYLAVITL